ncbi:MAG: ThuA domain-containing protein [Bacteroidota bacterium]
MKKLLIGLSIIAVLAFGIYYFLFAEHKDIHVLVFSKTEQFRHASIPDGIKAIIELGEKHGFTVDTTEDASYFKEKQLANYNVVVFLNTTGDVLNDAQQLEFNRFIQAGGGFVGIHAAADTEYDWPWYNGLVGAYFNGHPSDPNVREAVIQKVDKTHDCTKHLPDDWKRLDEWYNYKSIQPHINVLLNLDERTYEGGTNGENHPITWLHEYDGGRAFYTGLGHTPESFQEPAFQELLWQGIYYAAGPGKPVNYNLSTVAPEENRFVKNNLEEGLNEPMELEILPNGNLLYIERSGNLKIFEKSLGESQIVAKIPVHMEHEDGLLGLALDPNFADNKYLYLFYSPPGNTPKQHVSRFTMDGTSLVQGSEKVLLEIPVQREQCCHSAGSLEFGADGLLYIAVGDNTNPHASDGYAPSDERPGRAPWDAQKSSANTHDLRGKILRIRPTAEGGYNIPDGNLFPADGSKGRPEIYVMGCRNPYRIAIDEKNDVVYWGDVGPDAGKDSTGLGPMGYDEINQAKGPGFFGWPYFIGNNQAYHKRDFAKNVALKAYDQKKPLNTSPNNTGAEVLPEAQPAFIWYPYGASEEFPIVGDGGRNAMAGGVYHFANYPATNKRLPEYYDKKLFVYDWMRGWIMAVTMTDDQQFERIERFMPSTRFSNPVDFTFGPDGDIYMLEYGTVWFSQNPDARLVHIEYIAGNRKPGAKMEASTQVGGLPLSVQFTGDQSRDFDGDDLQFEWFFTDDEVQSTEKNPSFTFDKPGTYKVRLRVSDTEGKSAESQLSIMAGNDLPQVAWELEGNRTFFFKDRPLKYNVKVKDTEDGELLKGIQPDAVAISMDYLSQGKDVNEIALGHKAMMEATGFLIGKRLMENSDCATCHQMKIQSVGPSYEAIAAKYKEDAAATGYLAERIIQGGGGVWGETAMAAHPQLSKSEAEQMSRYILSLSGRRNLAPTLPPNGTFALNKHKEEETEGTYILTASYTDQGGEQIGPLTGRSMVVLRHPTVPAHQYDAIEGAMKFEVKKGMAPGVTEDAIIVIGNAGGHVLYKNIDLTYIRQIQLIGVVHAAFLDGGTIELRTGSPDGELLGSVEVETTLTSFDPKPFPIQIEGVEGAKDLYVCFVGNGGTKPVVALGAVLFSDQAPG